MNREQLQNKLNELLVGKEASYNYNLCKFIDERLSDLGLDNKQGVYGVRHENYTLTITYKNRELVSFEIKRKADPVHRWVVKEVIVDDLFIDYEHKLKAIRESYKKAGEEYDDRRCYLDNITFEDLKNALRSIKRMNEGKTKEDIKNLVRSLDWSYWLVDEVLESEGE